MGEAQATGFQPRGPATASRNTALAKRSEVAQFVVKYTGRDVPEIERNFGSQEEAETFAIALVQGGDATPSNINIYQHTGIVVRVLCEAPPTLARR